MALKPWCPTCTSSEVFLVMRDGYKHEETWRCNQGHTFTTGGTR